MKYRAEIDGLRAIAVVPVIFFHAGFSFFSGGFVGVDVFFVISGYLICTIIIDELDNNTFTLRHFYERRARRLLPALFFMQLLITPVAISALSPIELKNFAASLAAVSVFASNILFTAQSGGYFNVSAESNPLLHTWSLAVEEQYYLIFPVFLLLFWRLPKRLFVSLVVVGCICSLLLAHWATEPHPTANFFLLPTRIWELLVGVMVALYLHNGKQAVPCGNNSVAIFGLILVAYATFTFDSVTPYPSLYTVVPVIGTALLILYARSKNFIGRLLSGKYLVGIGLISYSAYLWHQPIFVFARLTSEEELSFALLLAFSASAFGAAYLSWRFVEKPFRTPGVISRKQLVPWVLIPSVVLLLTAGYIFDSNGLPGRFTVLQQVIFAHSIPPEPYTTKCMNALELGPEKSLNDVCVIGDKTVDPTIALWGDSHGAALAPGLDTVLANLRMSAYQVTTGACPPIPGVQREKIDPKDAKRNIRCNRANNFAIEHVVENQSIETIIMIARWSVYFDGTPFNNEEGGIESGFMTIASVRDPQTGAVYSREELVIPFENLVISLASAGKRVILINPIPEVGWNPIRIAARKASEPGDLSTSRSVYENRNRTAINSFRKLAELPNVRTIDSANAFCNEQRCFFTRGKKPLYFDDDHLSEIGALALAGIIDDVI